LISFDYQNYINVIMKAIFISVLTLVANALIAQRIDLYSRHAPADWQNVAVEKIADDSLSTTFLIWVREGVKKHFHQTHTEHVSVIEGTGEMTLGDSTFIVKPGDFLLIPKGTPHAVTAHSPMKVLSIQTPRWTVEDRVFLPVIRRGID
jgi:mannose-6-phosphate isomerase-like protein (cupin superfamily)